MDDPYEVLGVPRDAEPGEITRRYRDLVRRFHPDAHSDASDDERAMLHDRMARITAAYRMINDPDELERHHRLRSRRTDGRTSVDQPGRDGVHFTAADPSRGGGVEPSPGDPDFDYRARAPSEFTVRDDPADRRPWTARKVRRGGRWRRGRS